MKVSEKLPPVLMREYRDQSELMAVFTRPSAKSSLTLEDFAFVARTRRCCARCCATPSTARSRRQRAAVRPARHRQDRAGQGGGAGRGLELFEVEYADRDGNSLSGRDRYRSLQIAQVFLKGSAQAALLFDEVEDVFPPISSEGAQLMARAEQVVAPPSAASAARPGSTRSWSRTRCPPSGSPTASSRSTRRSGAASPTTWS
jgi:hypothetical protein